MTLPVEAISYLTDEHWASALNTIDNPELLGLPIEVRFFVLAIGAACPVPQATFDYFIKSTDPIYNFEWLVNRYDTTNRLSRITWDRTRELNPALHQLLTSTNERHRYHPVGHFEEGNVPLIHLTHQSKMSTLEGYAISRELELRLRMGVVRADRPYLTMGDIEGLAKTDLVRDRAIIQSKTPAELLARLTLAAVNPDFGNINPIDALSHALDSGKHKEENDLHLRLDVVRSLRDVASAVYMPYELNRLRANLQEGFIDPGSAGDFNQLYKSMLDPTVINVFERA